MLTQEYCFICKSRFYAGEDDMFKGKLICSHCMPRVKICSICGIVYKGFKTNSYEGSCPDCRKEFSKFNDSFGTVWQILRFHCLARDLFTCRYCGRSPLKDKDVILQCDHIIPKSKGGTNKLSNLITSCEDCNMGKLDLMLDKHKQSILEKRRMFDESAENNKRIKEEWLNKVGDK